MTTKTNDRAGALLERLHTEVAALVSRAPSAAPR